ncbi:MAG: MFS transporter [bacterium]|nr:MFS transporter [bacterium]
MLIKQKLLKIFPSLDLTKLWLAQVIGQSGQSMYHIGLLWITLELTNSETATGWVATIAYLPSLVLGLFAGVVADRYHRKFILMASDLLACVSVLFIPIFATFYQLTPTLIAINAFLVMAAGVFFNPARDALVPQIVPENQLLQANTFIQTSWQFSLLIGPAIAGYILEKLGKIHLFGVVSIFYLVSFVFVWRIQSSKQESTISLPKDLGLKDILEGLVYIAKSPILLPLLLITILDNLFIMGPAIVGTPVFIREELKLSAAAYATTEFCYAIGMIVGSALLWKYGQFFPKGKTLLLGMFLDGITFIPIFIVQDLLTLQITFIIHSFAIPFLIIPRAAIIQELVPQKLTGRVFSVVNISVVGMTAVSSALTGYLLDIYGARWVFLMIGIGGGVCGGIGWIFAKQLRNYNGPLQKGVK